MDDRTYEKIIEEIDFLQKNIVSQARLVKDICDELINSALNNRETCVTVGSAAEQLVIYTAQLTQLQNLFGPVGE